MKEERLNLGEWLIGVVPILGLELIRFWQQASAGYLKQVWWLDLLLLVGWIIGWFLAEADDVFYALVCNPQELTCQRVKGEFNKKNWSGAWRLLRQTREERNKLPIRNILTAFVMTGVGLWLVSSGSSLLAAGTCLGFSVKLYWEAVTDKNFKKWYWLFARDFTEAEHRGVMIAWGVVLIWQYLVLVRG